MCASFPNDNEVTALLAQWNTLKKAASGGGVSFADREMRQSQITSGMLAVLERLEL